MSWIVDETALWGRGELGGGAGGVGQGVGGAGAGRVLSSADPQSLRCKFTASMNKQMEEWKNNHERKKNNHTNGKESQKNRHIKYFYIRARTLWVVVVVVVSGKSHLLFRIGVVSILFVLTVCHICVYLKPYHSSSLCRKVHLLITAAKARNGASLWY